MGIALSLFLLAAVPQGTTPADAAFAVLQKNCLSCHGETGNARSYLLLDHGALLKTGKVIPGRAEESVLYKRISGSAGPRMPAGAPALPAGDIAIIKQWIDDGAAAWASTLNAPRRFISNDDVLAAIERDITSGTETSRRFYRYFVLTNLHNAGDTKLPTYRQALAKLINSLSWDKDIILPAAVDKDGTILRIDVRDYGWSDPVSTWETILAGYPYGVDFSSSPYARIQTLTGTTIPFIRADWFLAAASVPPLYHDILELPANETDLETCSNKARRCLNIDTAWNLREAAGVRVIRAGFTESGVSNSNRIVERHRSPFGAYWKSHDFPDNIGDHNIFQHPLDFQRAGGEIIFNLPNGLQAYLLVNERGDRIDQAPTNIVFNKGASRAEIRNGASCMSCHSNGMRPLTDDVRATVSRFAGYDSVYTLALYADNQVMNRLITEDQSRFEAALSKMSVTPGVEPIGELLERYGASVNTAAAAAELGLSTEFFVNRLKSSETLRQLGLATLLSGGIVKRDWWEDVFGIVIDELGRGVYVSPTRAYGERFFAGGSLTAPARPPRLAVSQLLSSIVRDLPGRTIRSVESQGIRTYSIKEVRSPAECSLQVVDITRVSDATNPSFWSSEEDVQEFALNSVQAVTSAHPFGTRLTISANAGQPIRLTRSLTGGGIGWNERGAPLTTTEFVNAVQFDLPSDVQTTGLVVALREVISLCSQR